MMSIIEIEDTLVSVDLFTEKFCCDLDKCKGVCCVEGDSGAPLDEDEILGLEEALGEVWDELDPKARKVINREGVATIDRDGDLVTSIVGNKDCVFTCYSGDTCLCALEKAYREGRIPNYKPQSCFLYPVRLSRVGDKTALNYNRWDVCHDAVVKGRREDIPVYKFLKEPLTRRFGKEWYAELSLVADELKKQGMI